MAALRWGGTEAAGVPLARGCVTHCSRPCCGGRIGSLIFGAHGRTTGDRPKAGGINTGCAGGSLICVMEEVKVENLVSPLALSF